MAFQADKRYYVDHAHQQLVDEDNPDGCQLLVAEGGFLTDEDAAAWGLAGKSKNADPNAPKPSPEQAQGNAQGITADDRDTGAATAKALKGSKNKAVSAPDETKADDGSGVSFSAGQPADPVTSANAPAEQIQSLPTNLTAPGS